MDKGRAETSAAGVVTLGPEGVPAVVDVLCEAFETYPVMRWVLGPDHGDAARLRALVDFFVMARVYRGETLLGIGSHDRLEAAALVSRPGRVDSEPLARHREALWRELGADARLRYQAFGATCARFEADAPHIHLNMIGVRRAARGTGLGRVLLEHVHALSKRDASSTGVSLTTEDPRNVPLYLRFGYHVAGEGDVSPSLHTWSFFRPDDSDVRGAS